jgi:hypothetical protein
MTLFKHLKTPLRVLAIFLLFMILIYILVTQTNLPERLAAKVFERMVGKQYGLTLSVDDIGGSVFSNLSLKGLQVYADAGDTLYLVANINEVALEYSLTDLWRKQWVLKKMALDELEVGLHPEVLNRFKGVGARKSSSNRLNFKINVLEIGKAGVKLYGRPDPTLLEDLGLRASFAKKGDSLFLNLDTIGLSYRPKAARLEYLRGNFVLVDSVLTADSVHLNLLGSRLDFSAVVDNIKNPAYHILLKESYLDLNKIGGLFDLKLVGDLEVRGEIDGNLTKTDGDLMLVGSLFEKHLRQVSTRVEYVDGQVSFYDLRGGLTSSILRGDGLLDFKSQPNEYLFSGRMENFNLNSMVENTFETAFTGEVILEGQSFSEDEFMLNLRLELDSGFFDVYRFDSVSGYADVYMDSIVFPDPLRVEDRGALAMVTGKIDYTHDLQIDGYADFSRLEMLTELLQLENIRGRGRAEFGFEGSVEDPRLHAEFISDSLVGYDILCDSLDLKIRLDRFISSLEGDMSVSAGVFHYDRYDGDSLYAEVGFDSNVIHLDTLEIFSKRLNAALSMDVVAYDSLTEILFPELMLVMDTFHIIAEDTIMLGAGDSLFSIERLKLRSGSGRFEARGDYYYDDSLHFRLNCNDLKMGPIFGFYIPEQLLTGIFAFSAEVDGSLENPVFQIRGRADSVTMLRQEYGDVSFALGYHDSSLMVDSFVLKGAVNMTRIKGLIPYNLAFADIENRMVGNKKIDLEIGSRGTTFFLLPVILPDLEWIEGTNTLDARISGTLDKPELDGYFYLRDGSIKTYYLANILENVNADLELKGRRIIFDRLTTTVKNGRKNGSASLTGFVSLEDNLFKPSIELELKAHDFPFQYDLGEIEGTISEAQISVSGTDTIRAVGSVEMSSFIYAEPFQPVIETEAMQAADTANKFNYIIDIIAPSNLRVVNQDANVELSGELRVFKQGNFQNFYGSLETIRGKYYFFDQTFTVLPEGEIIFDDIDEFNPRLNILVETHITSQGERLKARFLLSGTLNEPKLTAAEDSEVGEEHFFEWFSFQRFGTPGDTAGSPFTDRLKVGASEIAMNRVSQYFARRIGIETFEINPYFAGDEMNLQEAELRVGLYTLSNLYIYGATQLDFKRAREVGFEYRFSRRFYLSGQRDEEDLYHLNLNWNWEF